MRHKKSTIKVSGQERALRVVNFVCMVLAVFLCMYPFWYLIIYSLSDPAQASRGVWLLPKGFTIYAYQWIMENTNFGHAFLISTSRTLINTVLCLLGSSLFAYLVTQRDMIARKFIYRFVIITMYLGAGLVPYYITMKSYHLNNSYLLYIIPGILNAYYVILIKTFIEQIPASLEESAVLDGAGAFTVYRYIILPLSKPIVATIATFTAVGQWNSYMDNYLYVSKTSLNTLQYLLYKFLNSTQELTKMLQQGDTSAIHQMGSASQLLTPMGVRMTITVITVIPIFMVYPFMQKYFSKGIMLGAVKG